MVNEIMLEILNQAKGEMVSLQDNLVSGRLLPFYFGISGVINEITPDGNISVIVCAPKLSNCEIENFKFNTARMFLYENNGMTALLFSGMFKAECAINPRYYLDERYELLKQNDEILIRCFLCDTNYLEIVDAKVLSVTGKQRDRLVYGFEQNSRYTKGEYDSWIDFVLYRDSFNTNCKSAENLGVCKVSSDTEIIIV